MAGRCSDIASKARSVNVFQIEALFWFRRAGRWTDWPIGKRLVARRRRCYSPQRQKRGGRMKNFFGLAKLHDRRRILILVLFLTAGAADVSRGLSSKTSQDSAS